MAYRGVFSTLQNPQKYIGNPTNITFRSLWERGAFSWCDTNPDIAKWCSEEVVIPYVCATDGKPHRYFTDLYIEYTNGRKVIVEIKPSEQTRMPEQPSRKTRKYLSEVLRYTKNVSKWDAAKQFCDSKGIDFEIWTEKTLKEKGIPILNPGKKLISEERRKLPHSKYNPKNRRKVKKPKRRS